MFDVSQNIRNPPSSSSAPATPAAATSAKASCAPRSAIWQTSRAPAPKPAGYVHPLAIKVMAEVGIDISGHRSKHLKEFLEQPVHTVITVCGNADAGLSDFSRPGEPPPLAVLRSGQGGWQRGGNFEMLPQRPRRNAPGVRSLRRRAARCEIGRGCVSNEAMVSLLAASFHCCSNRSISAICGLETFPYSCLVAGVAVGIGLGRCQ